MIKYFFLYITLISVLYAMPSDPYKNIKYFELKNGLKVYLLNDTKAVNTQIEMKVNVGMSVENEENAGISHLLEHLVFRDTRIAHNDYLDYLEEEGATYINGYTQDFNTIYTATIDANKSEFIVSEFANMIFDKSVTVKDLEIEKRALQNEIGEVQWYHKFFYVVVKFFKSLEYPDTPDIFKDSFDLKADKEQFLSYRYKINNSQFTLDEVLKHYEEYYYPKNMTLKVVGSFDEAKISELIKEKYGRITLRGEKKASELPYDAKLEKKPYRYFTIGESDKSIAYIGTRYIVDDYKKYLILYSYSEHLASKMQKLLRNKLGQTYSVLSYSSTQRNGALSGVILESLHQDFEENLNLIQEQISHDIVNMDVKEIQEALKQSELYYAAKEHDAKTLMSLVSTQEYIQKYQNIYNKSAYEIFKDITPMQFQKVISETYKDEYRYLYIYKDYYIFPFDMLILSLLLLGSIIYFSKKFGYVKKQYTSRDVLFFRRLTNKFVSFHLFVFIILLALYLDSWLNYFFFEYFFDNPQYLYTLDEPFYLISSILGFIPFLLIYVVLLLLFFKRYFTNLDVTKEAINVVGIKVIVIEKSTILKIEKMGWNIKHAFNVYGVSPFFFKPLVKIEHKQGICYLRAKNAEELEEDLKKWLLSN